MEVAHLDGDALNNRRSNLAWVTHSENMKQAAPTAAKVAPDPLGGIHRVRKRLADGTTAIYLYHRPTRTRLPGDNDPSFWPAVAALNQN